MLKIDRMVLEDVGGNPVKLAQAVTAQLPDNTFPIPVCEIAAAVGIYDLRDDANVSFEGGLIAPDDKSEGAIVINGNRPKERRRYTIGHELGHYLNPWHKSDNPNGFQCNAKNLATEKSDKNNAYLRMEAEANEFSAELLMPENQLRNFLRAKSGADLEHIADFAVKFEVSKEAMARRYVEYNSNEPAAVVFSKNGIIRYVKKHNDFAYLNIKHGELLPIGSISSNHQAALGTISSWQEVSTGLWVDARPHLTVYEQTVEQANGFRMTLLTHEVKYDHGYDEDDEIDIEDSWEPKFVYSR